MEIVDTSRLGEEVKDSSALQQTDVAAIQLLAKEKAAVLMALSPSSQQQKRDIIESIESLGIILMRNSAHKNALLQVTVGRLSGAAGEGSEVSRSLAQLGYEIKKLDPSLLDFTREGVLGRIFDPVRRYFNRFEKADTVIRSIIDSLDKGRETLRHDNVTLELEQQDLIEMTTLLARELELGMAMDEQISQQILLAEQRKEDQEKIRFVTDEVLFPLRQRIMDMQQMLAVNQQGIVAIHVIRHNNRELINGVERAKTVTITALRTAVMVAAALYNQKIVMRKIELLNETTSSMIGATAKMLRDQGSAVQKQSVQTSVSPQLLKQAFQDAIAALDSISDFKQQALPAMQQTIREFRELAELGDREIARLERSRE